MGISRSVDLRRGMVLGTLAVAKAVFCTATCLITARSQQNRCFIADHVGASWQPVCKGPCHDIRQKECLAFDHQKGCRCSTVHH